MADMEYVIERPDGSRFSIYIDFDECLAEIVNAIRGALELGVPSEDVLDLCHRTLAEAV